MNAARPPANAARRPVPPLTLATRVTLARLLGIPVFILLVGYYTTGLQAGAPNEYHRVGALAVFLAVALTDALDGYLARSRNEVTALGRLLDPLADKTLLVSALLMLTRPGLPELRPQFPLWFTVGAIGRDVLLVIGAFVVRHAAGTLHLQPRAAGKLSTLLQMAAITWVLAAAPERGLPLLCGVALATALLAGVQYTVNGWRQIAAAHDAQGSGPEA